MLKRTRRSIGLGHGGAQNGRNMTKAMKFPRIMADPGELPLILRRVITCMAKQNPLTMPRIIPRKPVGVTRSKKKRMIPAKIMAMKAQSKAEVRSFTKKGAMRATQMGALKSRTIALADVVKRMEQIKHADIMTKDSPEIPWYMLRDLKRNFSLRSKERQIPAKSPLAEVMAKGFQETSFMRTPELLQSTAETIR
jgi:hypothetical protein